MRGALMNTTTTRLIRESFAGAGAMMAATNTTLVLSFYERLFATAPELRGMFAIDIIVQAEKLERTLEFAIASLSNPDLMIEPLRDLGARHETYGVEVSHYAVIANVLIETLAAEWGASWTDAHDAAWREMLAFVSDKMIEGARMRAAA